MITVLDYGMGNLGAVLNMLRHVGAHARLGSTAEDVATAEKLLLPGVGAFDAAMIRLRDTPGLLKALTEKVVDQRAPTLGICLGMQLMTEGSEEGTLPGLGWIKGYTRRFPATLAAQGLKVPHMGWNVAEPVASATNHPMWNDLGEAPRFYFVHSYFVRAEHRADVLATAHHGVSFDAVLAKGNIFAAQFHPERSHRFGAALLQNFAAL